MPGGLAGVEQTFSVDASKYVSGIQDMIRANREMIASVAEARRSAGDVSGVSGAAGMADDIAKVNAAIRDQLKVLGDAGTASASFARAHADAARAVRDSGSAIRDTSAALGGFAAGQEKVRAGSVEMAKAQRAADDAAMVLIKSHLQGHKVLADSGSAARSYSSDLGSLRDTAKDTTRVLADTANAVSAVKAAGSGGGGGPAGSLADFGRMMDQRAAAAGFASYRDAIAAAGLGPGGGGGGGAALGAAAGAAAGGGGGGGGGFVPWRGGGAQAVRFWGMMTAEVAATVVPALAAAGSAALVGMQSVEAMVPRYKAISATSESIGKAFGITTGTFLGGGSALQQAQDRFQGGGYVMAGNLLSMMQGGGGKGFLDMGGQTLGMLSRGTSAMALNFEQGTGKRLSDALGGGPGYLRQFGDIGANLGNTLLNVAPNLPGVGGDLLGTLAGGTGALATATRDIPGPLIGGLLSYEAASRWGPAMLGGKGLIGRMLGLRGVGGLGGLISKGGVALGGLGGSGSALEGLGLGISGLGEGLAGLGTPLLGGAGLLAYLIASGVTAKYGAGQPIADLQAHIGQQGFSGAFSPLAHAITTATGLSAPHYVGAAGAGIGFKDVSPDAYRRAGQPQQAAANAAAQWGTAAQGFTRTMGDLINSGPQLQAALKKAGLKGVGLADAFQIAQNALLDTSHAFGPHGKLTAVAQQMVTAYARVIGPMTQSPGAFGAAVGAQTIMSQGAMQNLAKVNQAMDAYQQIIAAGPTGASALAAGAHAAPAGAIAKGLTGYGTPANAAAWQAFASTSTAAPGFITQAQQFGDQMRTYLTLGTANLGQAKGFSASELQGILPQAKQSPAALAMLMQQGAAMGVTGYYDTSKTQAQNYKDAAAAIHGMAYSSGQFKKNMDSVTVATANVPAVAAQFANATAATVSSQRMAKVAQDAIAVKSGIKVQVNAQDIVSQLKAAGVSGGAAMKASLNAILSQAGVGKAQRIKIEAQVLGVGAVAALKAAIAGVTGKHVAVTASANTGVVNALKAAIASVQGKSVTVTVTTINRMITQTIGALTPPGGVAPMTLVGGPANMRLRAGAQSGMRIPGWGGGDIFPAMLEPGELVVPKHLVGSVAPILGGKIPGFAGGGGMGVMGFETMLNAAFHGDSVQNTLRQILDNLMAATIASRSQGVSTFLQHGTGGGGTGGTGPGKSPGGNLPTISQAATQAMQAYQAAAHAGGKQFSVHVLQGLADGIKNAGPAAKAAAAALLNKMQQEMAYAKSTSANMTAGLNFGGMNVDPATGSGPVQTQMQSYAASLKAFSADIKSMTKGGLSKDLLKQMIAAGPVQGDALAQSISQGPGGIKAVNALYGQIQHMSKGIGAQAAGAVFGGTIAPNMRSGTIINNNVSVNISQGSGMGGDLASLSPKALKSLMEQIQKELLKQAHRNRKTGTTVKGKGP